MDLLSNPDLKWSIYQDKEGHFDYPIDYAGVLLNTTADGHLELLYRWEPGKYCHFHRHIAPTSSLVLQGELHVAEYEDGREVVTKIRKVGDYSHNASPHDHMEWAGPEGAIVLFNIDARDGDVVQQLARDGTVLNTLTFKDVVEMYGRARD